MNDKPYVICHMTVSLDGKVTGNFLSSEEGTEAAEVYYEMNRKYDADGFACGRVTMESSFTGGWYPDLSRYAGSTADHEDYVAETDTDYYAVAFDRKGRLGWKNAKISDPDPGYDNAHIIEVLEEAEDAYLAYLRETGISYIFAYSIEETLIKLKKLFGIETLMLEGGAVINSSFLKADAVDEVSIVIVPVTGEPQDAPLFGDGCIRSFKWKSSETVNGIVCLKYTRE